MNGEKEKLKKNWKGREPKGGREHGKMKVEQASDIALRNEKKRIERIGRGESHQHLTCFLALFPTLSRALKCVNRGGLFDHGAVSWGLRTGLVRRQAVRTGKK